MRESLTQPLDFLERHVPPAAIVIGGVALAFATGLVPHRAHAFELLPLQVAAGLLPYVLFGIIAWLLRQPVVRRAGLIVLGAHLLAALVARGLLGAPTGGVLLVAVPLLLAAGLMTLWPRALQASAPREPSERG